VNRRFTLRSLTIPAWVHVGLVAASLAFFAFALYNAVPARAVTTQLEIYPGLDDTGLFDFGWHFQTSGDTRAARDYNFDSETLSTPVYLRMELLEDQNPEIRFIFRHDGQCGITVTMQDKDQGIWGDVSGTDMLYFHIDDRETNGATSTSVNTDGQTITYQMATLDDCDVDEDDIHLHQTGDIASSSKIWRTWYTDDTCWGPDGTGQCTGTYRADDSGESCPPGDESGTAGVTGSITRYVPCTWSVETRDEDLKALDFRW
jgi:hypothetical protein